MTAREMVLAQAPNWSEEQATAALRVVATQSEIAAYLDDEAGLSAEESEARDDRWATASARDAIREEPW
jgi:hypothetical protein